MLWRDNDWLYHETNNCQPLQSIEVKGVECSFEPANAKNHFDDKTLTLEFNSLRVPITLDWCTLSEREGFLRLYGRESLNSFHKQSLIARRVEHFQFEASTEVDFDPINFQQMAGLVCYYNTIHYHYLHVSYFQETGQKVLQIITCNKGENSEELDEALVINSNHTVGLKAKVMFDKLQFYYSINRVDWHEIGSKLDFSILSDDYVQNDKGRYRPAFTGAFVGLCCQDLSGYACHADFDYFDYFKIE